jgi:hypothetical protein
MSEMKPLLSSSIASPETLQSIPKFRERGKQFRLAYLIAPICVFFAFLIWYFFGSLPVALRFLRGERLILEPSQVRVGKLSTATPVMASTRICNYTSGRVRLLGFNSQCTCVVAQALPAVIPAGGTYDLAIEIRAIPNKQVVDEAIVIFTDNRKHPRLGVRVSGFRHD